MNAGPGQAGAHGPSSLPNWWPADPRHGSSSASDVMSQLCRVCGEPAAGFHFGAFTCEGCKSFFGRTYNNLGSISECKNNGECVINKKNRTSCKACRLRKCLVVGMSKSGSRYGRRSNWFKIHCLLQEQQQQQHHHQHQLQQHPQLLQQPALLGGVGVGAAGLHFQLHQQPAVVQGRPSSDPGRTPSGQLWPDVKHRLRLDSDNNNSVAGDLNKDGGRISAAAIAQAVRPELLRWTSPFFPTFPFPPPGPFFLQAVQRPTVRGPSRSTGCSPSSQSSTDQDDQDDGDGSGENERRDDRHASPEPVSAVLHLRDLPPVQESPMDLSVSAATALSRAPSSRSPSPTDAGGRRSLDPCPADRSGIRRTRHRRRRRRRRRRRSGQSDDRLSTSDGSELVSDGSESSGSGEQPTKNSPLNLTCIRPQF